MNDRNHPFFRPLWRRIAIVAFCCVWTAFEFYNKQQFWGMMAGGMALYGAWIYLLNYREPPPAAVTPEPEDRKD